MRRRQIDARSWVEGERSVELVGRDERTLILEWEEEGRWEMGETAQLYRGSWTRSREAVVGETSRLRTSLPRYLHWKMITPHRWLTARRK